jgi:hypothetical protein
MTHLVQRNNCAGCIRKRSSLSERPTYIITVNLHVCVTRVPVKPADRFLQNLLKTSRRWKAKKRRSSVTFLLSVKTWLTRQFMRNDTSAT